MTVKEVEISYDRVVEIVKEELAAKKRLVESEYAVGDKVKSSVDAQGMKKGGTYEVVGVKNSKPMPWGTFTTYTLKDETGQELQVGNGHLLLTKEGLREALDHAGIREVVNCASKLLAAVEGFKETASPACLSAVTPGLEALEKTLEDMVSTPGSYVAVMKKEPKVVSLKAVKPTK